MNPWTGWKRHRGVRSAIRGLLWSLSLVALGVTGARGQTVTVTTATVTEDGIVTSVEALTASPGADGKISLPEAIKAVNNTGPGFTINFALPNGSTIFTGASTYFVVQPRTTINGDANGDSAPDVLVYSPPTKVPIYILADHCAVRSLAIAGMVLASEDAHDCEVTDCYIGTDVSGEVAGPGSGNGIEIIDGAHHNTVERCVISGNVVPDPNWPAVGVFIYSDAHHNAVKSCLVGLNVNGNPLPNEIGIEIGLNDGLPGTDNIIGGQRPEDGSQGPGNVISGNLSNALEILGPGSTGNIVQGNFIGTDIEGKKPVPNGGPENFTPVFVGRGAANNTIGGARLTTHGGEGNLISGNGGSALVLRYPGTIGNTVQGNLIGTDITGTEEIPNGGYGIVILDGASGTVVGSPAILTVDANRGNLIRGNVLGGIQLRDTSTRGNAIRGNAIHGNGGRGIDLRGNDRADGSQVTPNDADDSDVGPNDLLNFPVGVTAAYERYTQKVVISGLITGPDPSTVTVDLYANETQDEVGFGEGQRYLGSAIPDEFGVFRYEQSALLPDGHHFISATATDTAGNTSEFSAVYGDPDEDGNTDTDGDGLCDDWEINGIDFDGDGAPDLLLNEAPFNAKPLRKDVFVEIDYMEAAGHTHRPNLRPDKSPLPADPLFRVVSAFANAPVNNVDGSTGVTLHLMVDEAIPDVAATRFGSTGPEDDDDFWDFKDGLPDDATDGHLGTAAERASATGWKVLGARSLAFHYALFAHTAQEGDTIGGIAEIESNDIIITMANWVPIARDVAGAWSATGTITPTEDEFNVEWMDAVSSCFMHELGHSLGLLHGGGVGIGGATSDLHQIHRKPNYLSVMNYARQFNAAADAYHIPGVPDGKLVRINRKLDYSRAALPALLEFSLDEAAGIGGPAGERTLYGFNGERRMGPADGPIDWNSDGDVSDTDLNLDVNYIAGASASVARGAETLHGHDDWSNLLFTFRASPLFSRRRQEATLILQEPTAETYREECLGGPRNPADALKIAGGILSASGADVVELNRAVTGTSATRLDLLDAVHLVRKAAGLDSNP